MQEVLDGVFHWTSAHPKIHAEVSSYWLEDGGVLIDPLVGGAGRMDWFAGRPTVPRAVLLSNRHHYREAGRFAERFSCPVHCNSAGLHEFTGGELVEGFEIGDQLPGGVQARAMDAICPDDTALLLAGRRAVVLADAVVRGGAHPSNGPLGFVPDSLMDDPPETRQRLLAACERLLEEVDFDSLLLAHGGPVIGEGRALLEALVACGGRTAFEL